MGCCRSRDKHENETSLPFPSKLHPITAIAIIWAAKLSSLHRKISLNVLREICEYVQGDSPKLRAVLENEVHCFDLATNEWQQLLTLRKNIKVDIRTSSTFIVPDCIVVCGGGGLGSACTRYVDSSAYMLEGNGNVQELPSMSTGRGYPGVAWDSVRKALYVFGGWNRGTGYTVPLRTSEMFMSKWSPLPNMHNCRCKFNPCLYSSILYLCGGYQTKSVETYDPRSNTFTLQDFTLPERGETTTVLESETLTVISERYISKLKQGIITSQKHGEYTAWSNSAPLVSGGVVYVVRLSDNCCRCIDLNTGAVQREARLK